MINRQTTRGKLGMDCPKWMREDLWARLLERSKDEKWIKKSNINRANRRGNLEDGKIVGTHNMGSISAVEKAARMFKANKKVPTAVEVFHEAHSRGGKLTTKKAQKCYDEYTTKKNQLEAFKTKFDENQLFLEVVGGRKKGKVYGLGEVADHYFQKAPSSSDVSSVASYAPGIVSVLEEQNKKLEEQNKQLEEQNKKLQAENVARHGAQEEAYRRFQEEMRKEFEDKFNSMFANCNRNQFGPRRDFSDVGDDGATGSFTAT